MNLPPSFLTKGVSPKVLNPKKNWTDVNAFRSDVEQVSAEDADELARLFIDEILAARAGIEAIPDVEFVLADVQEPNITDHLLEQFARNNGELMAYYHRAGNVPIVKMVQDLLTVITEETSQSFVITETQPKPTVWRHGYEGLGVHTPGVEETRTGEADAMKINPMIISHLLPSLRGLGVSRVLATGEADCPTLWIEHPSVREARNEVVHQLVEFEIEHPDVCFVYEIVGRGDQRSELTRGNPEVLFQ